MRIGFDLGGTKMLAAVFHETGRTIARDKEPTAGGDNEAVLRQVSHTIHAVIERAKARVSDIEAIGIAVPSPINAREGVILATPNLGVRDFPIARKLQREFRCPVLLENDVNAGLWGEYRAGCAQGYTDIVGIFPGTGIGGAMILDGALLRGKNGGAGEIGHLTVEADGRICGCGNHGCLETVASKTAIARDLVLLALNGRSPILAAAGATDIRMIKSGLIKRALEAGDPGVAEVVDRAARFLGIGMAAMVNIFDPQLVVLGGGLVEKLSARFTKTAEAHMHDRAMGRLVESVEVREAMLGDDAVVVGVADLTKQLL